jgi:WD40 repeat protein
MGCSSIFNLEDSLRIPPYSYKDLKNEKDYYIVCPKCRNTFPNINEIDYNLKINDFIISYICDCSYKGKDCLLLLINEKRPSNIDKKFIEKEHEEKIIKLAEEKKGEFEGFEIIKKIIINHKQKFIVKSNFSDDCLDISFDKNTPIEFKKYILVKTLNNDNSRIFSLIHLNSNLILTGSENGKIYAWDLKQESPTNEIQAIGKIFCLLEFEDNMILTGNELNTISLWNLNSKQKLNDFNGHEGWITSLVKCDDYYFASSSNDYNIIIWNFREERQFRIIEKAHDSCVLTLIKLKDDSICSSGADFQIKKWDWRTGECTFIIIGVQTMKLIRCLCELEDGTLLSGSDDNLITIWKGEEIYKTLEGHEHCIKSICQIDEEHFASGGFDNKIKIWECKNNYNYIKCVQTLEGHQSNINCVINLNDNENVLVSCSSDRTIKVWKPV